MPKFNIGEVVVHKESREEYEVLNFVPGRTYTASWSFGYIYRSLGEGKVYWQDAQRFEERFDKGEQHGKA